MGLVTALKALRKEYPVVATGTSGWPRRALLNTPFDFSSGLPNHYELADRVFTKPTPGAANTPAEPQVDDTAGFVCWDARPGTILEIRPVIYGADNAVVNALFGVATPIERVSPAAGDPVQWNLDPLALMVWTAGAHTGIAGGIVDASGYYADTIAITTAFWPEPNPLRIVGPRTSVGDATLAPDDTPVSIQWDIMGGVRPFLYLSLGANATGVNVLERSF